MKKGFSLLEIMMMLAIIAILASMMLPFMALPFKHAKLAVKRSWVKSIIKGYEGYYNDHSQYPGNLGDLSGAVPPYLKTSQSVYCGFLGLKGDVIVEYSCGMGNANTYYEVRYRERDLSSHILLSYYEARVKTDYSNNGCDVKAGGVYFHEIIDEQVIRTSCSK